MKYHSSRQNLLRVHEVYVSLSTSLINCFFSKVTVWFWRALYKPCVKNHSIQDKNYLSHFIKWWSCTMVNAEVTMVNGDSYDAVQKEKCFVNSEVPKDVDESKASKGKVPVLSSTSMQSLIHLYNCGSHTIQHCCRYSGRRLFCLSGHHSSPCQHIVQQYAHFRKHFLC